MSNPNQKTNLKGIVHLKMYNSPSYCSKPVRPSFIFGTQIKYIFDEFQALWPSHRQQGHYNDQDLET